MYCYSFFVFSVGKGFYLCFAIEKIISRDKIMTHGSLFSGIGGFEIAAEWAGWKNKFHCEWNEFGQRILRYYWPNATSYGDITKTDFTIWRGRIDVLTGGFPCQPYSTAGKRLGKEDERHLWPEMLRAIQEIQPRYVVGENVPGLINWNGGMVFDEVQADLEAAGYEVIPFILPAASVSAPHRRERVWFVAHANDQRGCTGFGSISEANGEIPQRNENAEPGNESNWNAPNAERTGLQKSEQGEQYEQLFHVERNNTQYYVADTGNTGLQGSQDNGSIGIIRTKSNKQSTRFFRTDWENFPAQSPVCNGDDGLSSRLDGITFSKWRAESIKAGGNAIVPQVTYQIFKAINEYELISGK